MRRTLLIVLTVLLLPAVAAGQETLLGGGIHSGGYGGPGLKFTSANGEMAVMGGGQGAWVINHTAAIGGGGYGLTSDHEVEGAGGPYKLNFSYGGLLVEYIRDANELVHWYGSLIVGFGSFSLTDPTLPDDSDDIEDDGFLVLEPTVNIELNVTEHFRLAAGAGYRLASGVTSDYLAASDLSGATFNLALRFGSY